MNTLLVYVAAASLGWQAGWQRMPEGGMEYIIQLDAAALAALRDGRSIQSYVPADIGEVRAFRVIVGTGKPRQDAPPLRLGPTKNVEKPSVTPPAGVEKGGAAKVVENTAPQQAETAGKPWMALTLTLLALFASIGANVFLGWIAWGLRRRCQGAA